MATFAELILGGGPGPAAPPPPPRPAQRRPRKTKMPSTRDGEEADSLEADAR